MHAGIGAVHVVFFVACELAAFVMGILAWPDRFAKATVITISIMAVVLLLIFWEVRVEA